MIFKLIFLGKMFFFSLLYTITLKIIEDKSKSYWVFILMVMYLGNKFEKFLNKKKKNNLYLSTSELVLQN